MHSPSLTRSARGFTLIELMMTLVVVSMLATAVMAVVIHQTRTYDLSSRMREVVGANRTSVTFIERRLRMAGFGVDPRFAFDFGRSGDVILRDSTTGPDELVFFARAPGFYRTASASTATSLTLNEALTRPLRPGQVLLVICPTGSGSAYVTVSGTPNLSTVSLYVSSGNFPRQALPACADPPYVLKVDRYRFFVADVNEGGRVRPYLLLDQGVEVVAGSRGAYDALAGRFTEPRDPLPGNAARVLTPAELQNLTPLAADVEDFQVAWLMNRPEGTASPTSPVTAPDADANWVFGDSAVAEQPRPGDTAPTYEDTYLDADRFTGHPANLRGVRVTLVIRSPRPVGRRSVRPAVENRAQGTATDDYYRSVISTQVSIRNMLSRSEFAPVVVNVEGGS